MHPKFIYSKPPYANILDSSRNPVFKIMAAIQDGLPPATPLSNCSGTISGLWNLFEACWDKDPSKRPEAATICQFLKDNEEDLIIELEK